MQAAGAQAESSVLTPPLLPPSLIHALRARSFPRLFRMTGNPGNRGFGRVLRRRIRDLVARERTLVEKAITVAYLGSFLVDHFVQAERTATLLIEHRQLGEEEEHRVWERTYGPVIRQLCRELAHEGGLPAEIRRIERYDQLPARIFRFRSAHWRLVEAALRMLPASPSRPEGFVAGLIEQVLESRRSPRRKALAVALLASLLADRTCWSEHVDWPHSYREAMVDFYPLLVRHGAVLEQLVRIDPD